MMKRPYSFAIATAFLCGPAALADIRNLAPVQEDISYAVPFIAVLAFGGFGLFVLAFAFTCPRPARPFLLAGGSLTVLGQYLGIIIDLEQYGDAFVWYDAFLLPGYCVFLPEAYTDIGHAFGLVLPCLFIIVSTAAIPAAWVIHGWTSAAGPRQTGPEPIPFALSAPGPADTKSGGPADDPRGASRR